MLRCYRCTWGICFSLSGLLCLNGECVESTGGLLNPYKELRTRNYKELFKSLFAKSSWEKEKTQSLFYITFNGLRIPCFIKSVLVTLLLTVNLLYRCWRIIMLLLPEWSDLQLFMFSGQCCLLVTRSAMVGNSRISFRLGSNEWMLYSRGSLCTFSDDLTFHLFFFSF